MQCVRTDLKIVKEITYNCTDDEHRSSLVVMFSTSDNIPFLALAIIAIHNLDRGQVCAEIPRKFVDKKTLSIRRLHHISVICSSVPLRPAYLNLGRRKSASSAVIAWMSFVKCGLIELLNSPSFDCRKRKGKSSSSENDCRANSDHGAFLLV